MPEKIIDKIIIELLEAADMAAAERITRKLNFGIKIRDKSAYVHLSHGLGIRLRKDGGAYILTIWRVRKMPAMREWNVVTGNFPYDVPITTPTGNAKDTIFYYTGRIPGRPE